MRRIDKGLRGGRVLALILGLGLMMQWGMTHTADTEATWAASEGGQVELSARRISPPTISSCTYEPGVAGILGSVIVYWSFPAGSSYVQPANAQFQLAYNAGNPAVVPTPTGTASGAGFATRISLGLLGGTLGGTYRIQLRVKESNSWTSQPATAVATVNLLTAAYSCSAT
ncbi:hypothetical protein [Agreia sp. COWG]|uniref:hypothetical protein n=1 Tax=Agreia sp. COWG TaxID=2773266 RepID=UPI0019254273|nr:hypothetical protein [Agreia sp. COWG]CAD5992225.1 conserved protein of unknown function [Agreia sp. COWG]